MRFILLIALIVAVLSKNFVDIYKTDIQIQKESLYNCIIKSNELKEDIKVIYGEFQKTFIDHYYLDIIKKLVDYNPRNNKILIQCSNELIDEEDDIVLEKGGSGGGSGGKSGGGSGGRSGGGSGGRSGGGSGGRSGGGRGSSGRNGSGLGGRLGKNNGQKSGTKYGAKPGKNNGGKPGKNNGGKSGPNNRDRPGSNIGNKLGNNNGGKPGNNIGKPGSKYGDKTGNNNRGKPSNNNGNKPGPNNGNKPGPKTESKPGKKNEGKPNSIKNTIAQKIKSINVKEKAKSFIKSQVASQISQLTNGYDISVNKNGITASKGYNDKYSAKFNAKINDKSISAKGQFTNKDITQASLTYKDGKFTAEASREKGVGIKGQVNINGKTVASVDAGANVKGQVRAEVSKKGVDAAAAVNANAHVNAKFGHTHVSFAIKAGLHFHISFSFKTGLHFSIHGFIHAYAHYSNDKTGKSKDTQLFLSPRTKQSYIISKKMIIYERKSIKNSCKGKILGQIFRPSIKKH